MSHEFAHGEHFVGRHTAWHGLGTIVPEGQRLTVVGALEMAHMNWLPKTVVKQAPRLTAEMVQGDPENGVSPMPLTTKFSEPAGVSVYRPPIATDKCQDTFVWLGDHKSERYTALPNIDLFSHCQTLLDKFPNLRIDTCGQLHNGSVPFMLLSGDSAEVQDGDRVQNYLLTLSSHNGWYSTQNLPTKVRVVCSNTLEVAMRAAQGAVKVRHTASQDAAIKAMFEAVEIQEQQFRIDIAKFKAMAETQITQDMAEEHIRQVFELPKEKTDDCKRSQNMLDKVMAIYSADAETSDGLGKGNEVHGGAHTVWRVHNAVTEYTSHHGGNSLEANAKGSLGGSAKTRTDQSLELATATTSAVAQYRIDNGL